VPENLSPWDQRVECMSLDEYAKKYEDFFVMTRRDGILELRLHTDGGPFQHTWKGHNAWNQAWIDVGRDPENEVIILTGTGDRWHSGSPEGFTPFPRWTTDSQMKTYSDVTKLLESMIFNIDVPTIGAINGPGTHAELVTLCDITLSTQDADFFDPHFLVRAVPGDGMALTLQHTLGIKRASYYAYTGNRIDGRTAKELGIVNEVLPREQLLPRAWELAEMIMQRPRHIRRLTHAVLSRPWKQALVNDLGFHVGHQFFGMMIDEDSSAEAVRRNIHRFADRP
jgi:enoyl-CoA hydratase/carnithine racemase